MAASSTSLKNELAVQALTETSIHGNKVAVGLSASYFTDPTDKNYLFICPKIYVEQKGAAKPRHIMMMVDTSSSMAGEGIEAIKAALPQVFAMLNPEDRVSLTTFDTIITPVITNQSKKDIETAFHEAVHNLNADGSTALNDTILSIGNNVETPDAGHTTVLLFSDGENTSPAHDRRSVDEIIKALTERFNGHPPRILPIGLGQSYDHNYIKTLAITCNYGMIDARDQTKLPTHVQHIESSLAHGVHVDLFAGSTQAIRAGILEYNTRNEHTPIRVKASEFAKMGLGFRVGEDNKVIKISTKSSLPKASLAEQNAMMQTYIKAEAKKIYDNLTLGITDRMKQISALIIQYHTIITLDTSTELDTLMNVLDKKQMLEKAIATMNDENYYPHLRVHQRFDKGQEEGRFNPLNPENNDYMDTLRDIIVNKYSSETSRNFTVLSIVRTPPKTNIAISETEVSLPAETNRFVSCSTVNSTPFTATLSVMTGVNRQQRNSASSSQSSSSNEVTLTVGTFVNRNTDFAKLRDGEVVESVFYGREILRLDTNKLSYKQQRSKKTARTNLQGQLENAIAHVRSEIYNTDLRTLGLGDGKDAYPLEITQCLKHHTGVCRHHSLYLAWYAGQMVKNGDLPPGKVNHYRAATNELKAHSFVIYTPDSKTKEKVYYLLDSMQNVCERIADQKDFERCVKIYNEKGLYWILRNFAKDHGFTYPASENSRPFSEQAIERLQEKVVQYNLLQQFRELALIAPNATKIAQTEQNRPLLWEKLVEHQCILPEEHVETYVDEDSEESDSGVRLINPDQGLILQPVNPAPASSASQPSGHKREIDPKARLERLLTDYKTDRQSNDHKHKRHFFWMGFGFSMKEKVEAVDALLKILNNARDKAPVTPNQLAALRNGELGNHIREFVKEGHANKLLPGQSIRTVRDLVKALQPQPAPSITWDL